MSWGERSCKHLHDTEGYCCPALDTCNVNCPLYERDLVTQPDSEKSPEPKVQARVRRPKAKRKHTREQGRNQLCACGSGKKYKRCCGDKRRTIERALAINERRVRAAAAKLDQKGMTLEQFEEEIADILAC